MPTTAELQAAAVSAANKYGIPVNMFLWQIGKESSWNPNAKNPAPGSTATGLGQFIATTAKDFNLNPLDPIASLDAAAKYDAMLYKQTGSWQGALEKYGTLHGATAIDMAGFQGALAADGAVGNNESGVMETIKQIWNNSMGGLAVDTYKNLTGRGDETSGNWEFTKLLGTGTFIILGIIIIALAILSNKQVQQVAVAAVTKGAK